MTADKYNIPKTIIWGNAAGQRKMVEVDGRHYDDFQGDLRAMRLWCEQTLDAAK